MMIPDKIYQDNSTTTRFGFNGMEREDEIAGLGNSYTAMFWQYDSRTGRRWNLDPVDMFRMSRYATFANNPIVYTDPFGDEYKLYGYEEGYLDSETNEVNSEALELDLEGLSEDVKQEQRNIYNGISDYSKGLLADWEETSGYDLSFSSDGILQIDGINEEENFSQTARAYIDYIVSTDKQVTAFFTPGKGSFADKLGTSEINIDNPQIQGFIDNTSQGMNPNTLGYGMVTFHELFHTVLGDKAEELIGKPEGQHQGFLGDKTPDMEKYDSYKLVNQIRQEMDALNNEEDLPYGISTKYGTDTFNLWEVLRFKINGNTIKNIILRELDD